MRGIANKFLVGVLLALTAGGAFAQRIPLTQIQQITANRVLGNASASTANITQQTMPSCSTAGSALNWTSNTGFGCNTSITANTATTATTATNLSGGTVSATTGAFSGAMTSTLATGQMFSNTSGATGNMYSSLQNTGGQMLYGIESSVGGTLFSGGSAYAAVFGAPTNTSLQFATNSTVRATITGAGAFSTTGTLTVGTINTGTGVFMCESAGLVLSGATTCVASAMRFKTPTGFLAPDEADRLSLLHPATYVYKDPARNGKGEKVGLYADEVAAMDSRCAEYDADGKLLTYDDRCVLAYVIADRQKMKAEIEALKEAVAGIRSMQYAVGRAFKRASFR